MALPGGFIITLPLHQSWHMMSQIHRCFVHICDITPRINSSVISATLPKYIRDSYGRGCVSPGAIYRMYSQLLSVSPEVMSGLAVVTDALVSMVTRHGMPPIQPSVFRLLSPLSANMSSVKWWGTCRMPAIPSFFQLQFVSRVSVTPFNRFLAAFPSEVTGIKVKSEKVRVNHRSKK